MQRQTSSTGQTSGLRILVAALAISFLTVWTDRAQAVDGVIEINQTRATAGGVTSGDTAGFPVTVSEAGSYRLTGNLTTQDLNTTSIQITADDVSLDLNGFGLFGPNVCTGGNGSPVVCTRVGTGKGIDALNRTGISVHNGTIRGVGSHGIDCGAAARIEGLQVISVGGDGIRAGSGVLVGNVCLSNRGNGLDATFSAVFRGNVSGANGGAGIITGLVSVAVENSVVGNIKEGILSVQSVTMGNAVSFNGKSGLDVGAGSTVIGNAAGNNALFGINMAAGGGSGFVNNVLHSNNGSDVSPQVSNGIQLGTNVCGGNTSCP